LPVALVALGFPACGWGEEGEVPEPKDPATSTRVVMLGSGGPPPDPQRSGPAAAVISRGRAYLVDFGPGVVRRAVEAFRAGTRELDPRLLTRVFATHLHSDHTAGYADLILTPPAVGRSEPLVVYGPPGIARMTRQLLSAYDADLQERAKGRSEAERAGYQVEAKEVDPGVVYRDEAVVVTAFRVEHGRLEHAYGYRFDADGRSIVFSGDTAPGDAVVEACNACDVLLHEVYCQADFERAPPAGRSYFKTHHTSTVELAELAKRAKPQLLILHHLLLARCSEESLLEELRQQGYTGEAVVARDLGVY
jgi:ribonuclease BN (tRNA processing enzyme)